MTENTVQEVVKDLMTLPSDRLVEAHDFILFLRSGYGCVVDIEDDWSDEDIEDITRASLIYGSDDRNADESLDGPPG